MNIKQAMPNQAFSIAKQTKRAILERSNAQCFKKEQPTPMISRRFVYGHRYVYRLRARPGSNACDSLMHSTDSEIMSDSYPSTALLCV